MPKNIQVVTPMLKKGPGNILKYIKYNAPYVVPAVVAFAATYNYGNWKFAQNAFEHRD